MAQYTVAASCEGRDCRHVTEATRARTIRDDHGQTHLLHRLGRGPRPCPRAVVRSARAQGAPGAPGLHGRRRRSVHARRQRHAAPDSVVIWTQTHFNRIGSGGGLLPMFWPCAGSWPKTSAQRRPAALTASFSRSGGACARGARRGEWPISAARVVRFIAMAAVSAVGRIAHRAPAEDEPVAPAASRPPASTTSRAGTRQYREIARLRARCRALRRRLHLRIEQPAPPGASARRPGAADAGRLPRPPSHLQARRPTCAARPIPGS